MQQNKKVDLKDVFCYPLCPVPWALATSNKELMKTNKSKLKHELEKDVTTADNDLILFASIFEEVALVRMFKCTGLTCKEFADDLLKFAVARSFGAKRIDIVFDVYYGNSIMLKEEISLLVNYSSKLLLAHLKLSSGVPFWKQYSRADSIFCVTMGKTKFDHWRWKIICCF